MDGDFKGDFTRDTFYPVKRFSRVLMQQGRVQLDADWNEQGDILTYYLRQLASAMIGPYGGPTGNNGFAITLTDPNYPNHTVGDEDFFIGMGKYYVDGILVQNNGFDPDGILIDGHYPYEDNPPLPLYTYIKQPYYANPAPLDTPGYYLVYLDVWEEQITSLEDNAMREVALGANQPDTAIRAQIVWQVRLMSHATFDPGSQKSLSEIVQFLASEASLAEKVQSISILCNHMKDILQPANRGQLKARAKVTHDNTDACIISPDAQYRGDENQLYRVEIHTGNLGHPGKLTDPQVTFKWSRDNASVVFPILSQPHVGDTTTTVIIGNVGRDDSLSIAPGDWVEIADEDYLLNRLAYPLLKVTKVDRSDPLNIVVTLDGKSTYNNLSMNRSPVLRRWDQRPRAPRQQGEPDLFDTASGTVKIVEGTGESTDIVITENWITLEDGVQIQFQTGQPNQYRTGDYWLIPARVVTGDVEWPLSKKHPGQHVALPPHGVEHHYAPLAIIQYDQGSGQVSDNITDLRFVFQPQATLVPPS